MLEEALNRNTAAIEKLIAILANPPIAVDMSQFPPPPAEELSASMQLRPIASGNGGAGAANATAPADTTVTETAKPKRASKKEAAPATAGEPVEEAPAPSPETTATDAPATEDVAAPGEPLTYAQVQAATLAAVKAGRRTEVVRILDGYGVKRADQLSEEIWPEYLAALGALGDEVPF